MKITIIILLALSITGCGHFRGFANEVVGSGVIKIDISGASIVEMSGETVALDLDMSGASKVDTESLHATRVKISLSGAGKATVFASEDLNADVSGAGIVIYTGDPKTVKRRFECEED